MSLLTLSGSTTEKRMCKILGCMQRRQLALSLPGSTLTPERRAPAAAAAAASACGLTKGLLDGTRSSLSVWAKKHTRRLQFVPSLHSCVRYLQQQGDVKLQTLGPAKGCDASCLHAFSGPIQCKALARVVAHPERLHTGLRTAGYTGYTKPHRVGCSQYSKTLWA